MSRVDVGIAISAGVMAAVTRVSSRDPVPVLIDGWPTQTVNYRDQDAITKALGRIADATGVDSVRVVVACPQRMSSAARAQVCRSAVELAWPMPVVMTAPIAAGIVAASPYSTEVVAVVDTTAASSLITVLEPQSGGLCGHVAATISGDEDQEVPVVIAEAVQAGELSEYGVDRVVLIDSPDRAQRTAATLSKAGLPEPATMSPVELAAAALDANTAITAITGGQSRSPAPTARRRWRWPRPVLAIACAAISAAALLLTLPDPAIAGETVEVPGFALACLGLFSAAAAAAAFMAWQQLASHPGSRGWQAAGRTVVAGAGLGVVLVVGAVIVALTLSTGQAAATAWWGLAAVAPAAVAAGWTGAAMINHPGAPPERNLWPPAEAMIAVAFAAILIHGTELTTVVVAGDNLAGVKLGMGIAAYAVTGIVIIAGWRRVVAGLVAASLVTVIATPAVVPVLVAAIVGVVNGWWVTRAVQTTLDRREVTASSPKPRLMARHTEVVH